MTDFVLGFLSWVVAQDLVEQEHRTFSASFNNSVPRYRPQI